MFPVVLVGKSDGCIEAWDAQLGSRLCVVRVSQWNQSVTAINVSPDRATVAVGLEAVPTDVLRSLPPSDAHAAEKAPTLISLQLAASLVQPPALAGGREKLRRLAADALSSGDLMRRKSAVSLKQAEDAETLVFGGMQAVPVPQRGRNYPTCLQFASKTGGFLAVGYSDGRVELLAPATASAGRRDGSKLLRKRQLLLLEGGARAVSSAGIGAGSRTVAGGRSGTSTPIRRTARASQSLSAGADRHGHNSSSRDGASLEGPPIVALDFSSDHRAIRVADAGHSVRIWLPWSGSGKIATPEEEAGVQEWASSTSLHGWEALSAWTRAATGASAAIVAARS